MSKDSAISVTRLVRRMRNLLEIELGEVWVEGEISNLRRQSSGHCYFTLKDNGGQISCVLFRGQAKSVQAELKDGLQVRVYGEVSLYEARGSVQLIIRKVEEDGQGALQAKFEALKNKLQKEGLFEQHQKQALPTHPLSVGLITSATSAALQDMLHILGRRAPWIQPYLYNVPVQGKGAERDIVKALEAWSAPEKHQLPPVDVIIVGRGGGSLEDLWNFNEEVLARAIAACPIPIVSAVGHEIDFTIADFVADMRAPTPSAAVELISADKEELLKRLQTNKQALQRCLHNRIENLELRLRQGKRSILNQTHERLLREPLMRLEQNHSALVESLQTALKSKQEAIQTLSLRLQPLHPEQLVARQQEQLKEKTQRLQRAHQQQLTDLETRLSHYSGLLRTLGPESTFQRGFSITLNQDGKVIQSPDSLTTGDTIHTHFQQGHLVSRVEEVKKGGKNQT